MGKTSHRSREGSFSSLSQPNRIRIRGDLAMQYGFAGMEGGAVSSTASGSAGYGMNRVEDIFQDEDSRKSSLSNSRNTDINGSAGNGRGRSGKSSLYDFIRIELTRGYVLEHDEERYSARREKIYSFMKIPRELESFMAYGVLQCADSFLYIYTFLPIRFIMALWSLVTRPVARCLGMRRPSQRLLAPAEICDLLKGTIWIICSWAMFYVDTNMLYHLIKSQSIIKLYIFYNMLEVGDRLLSAFGQDIIDALFWTATEPKDSKKQHLGTIPHFLFAIIYVTIHSALVMFQATSLNVAINSSNKGLLTIMMSNNFVELKGSVFKKFDKNNLFQLSCSDVRERFHLTILMLIVLIQTMKEFNWKTEQFFVMIPDCMYVMITELFVDWIKHAFITRFNEIPVDVYREYTISLAYDMTQTRQKHAFSDHSDLVARRMGFIPFPLGVILVKALYHAISFDNAASIVIFIIAYAVLLSCRVLNTVCTLGKACDLMQKHQDEKNQSNQNSGPTSSTPIQHIRSAGKLTTDIATSPIHHPNQILQRSQTVESVVHTNIQTKVTDQLRDCVIRQTSALGATALFSNSDVDLDDVKLNDKVLNHNGHSGDQFRKEDNDLAKSVPDLQQGANSTGSDAMGDISLGDGDSFSSYQGLHHRTHKRSESEPSIQLDMERVGT
ncbi:protein TAPT1 homolog [Toxorhynchites rutilus septentrionalis]|uniref:protein TAPT1 homolog n=1 Tax=Toxorhynchites rutilus septentrionalis TaxID=329112 RepID=UPI00247AF86F|nr:protein TAPT1 homolog [Toxorhynchites rutilus septentrionalis]